ncbi:unnamed protein product, partial [Brassica rapa]
VRLRQSPNHWLLRAPPSLLILLLLPNSRIVGDQDVEVMNAKTRAFDHYKRWSLLNDETGNKRGGRVKLQPMVMPQSEFDHAEKEMLSMVK